MTSVGTGTVTVLGSINMDVVLRVAQFPQAGETIIAAESIRNLGGKGANQAIAAARAGASVRLIGTVGDDDEGRKLVALLKADGVDCEDVGVVHDQPTGTAYVMVDDIGENEIVVVAGANAATSFAQELNDGVLLAQLESPLEAVAKFLSARRSGCPTMLNAAPFRPQARRLLALADIIIVNEIELAGYCGRLPPQDAAQAAEMARELLTGLRQTVIVTRGSAGSLTVGPESIVHADAKATEVLDTTGAGDCFCGYVAAGLAAGHTLAASVVRGHQAAAIAVGRSGAAASAPHFSELCDRS
jgi:ribokinase